jgi:hypothetical protein
MWSAIGDIFVYMLCLVGLLLVMVGLVFGMLYAFKGLGWCFTRLMRRWRDRKKPRRQYTPPNPWENQPVVPPPVVTPPRPVLPPREKKSKPSRYVQQERDFEQLEELGPRSPVRLLYSAAFERLTDGELEEIRARAPEVIERLHRAAFLLSTHKTAEAENLLFVLRGYVRRYFGEGCFWLEAVITSDIAALAHHANKVEDADYHFAGALRVATPWFEKYPWLQRMVTRRRLMKN